MYTISYYYHYVYIISDVSFNDSIQSVPMRRFASIKPNRGDARAWRLLL